MLIIPANSASASGYAVDNSCRFNDGSSDNLSITPSSASNRKTWTYSCWFKLSTVNIWQTLFSAGTASNNQTRLKLDDNGGQIFFDNEVSGSSNMRFYTSRLFRDVSAWYHLVVAVDTTQSTESNRVKFYINGEQLTNFGTATYPSQNTELFVNATNATYIGRELGSAYFDGYMAETVLIDGSALAPTSFGEFDEDSGIWKPIDGLADDLTFGTNGFYLDFKDSAALGDDVSGNGNDFTVNNLTAIDQTTDTPTNNFATYNPLINTQNIPTFSEGNTQSATTGGGVNGGFSTIGMSSGKWYAEFKLSAHSGTNRCILGVTSNSAEDNRNNQYLGQTARSYSYSAELGKKVNNNSSTAYGDSYTTNDILGVALDLDNLKIYFAKNGTWQNSGDPESGATGTGAAFTVTTPASTDTGFYFFGVGDESGSHSVTVQSNFGNPPFTISSGNADGNSRGNFEYAVPSGYLSLCTANLSEVLS